MAANPSLIDSIITDIENARLVRLVSSSFRARYTNWPWILSNGS